MLLDGSYINPETNMLVGGKRKKAHTESNSSVSQTRGTLEVISRWAICGYSLLVS